MIHVPLRLWRTQTGTVPAALSGGGYRICRPRAAGKAFRPGKTVLKLPAACCVCRIIQPKIRRFVPPSHRRIYI